MGNGLTALLGADSNATVVGAVTNLADAVRGVGLLAPDLVVFDMQGPPEIWSEALQQIRRRRPATKVLVVSFHADEAHVHAALKAGAAGYLLKNDSRNELLNGIRAVLAGRHVLSPSICGRVIQGYLASGNLREVRLDHGSLESLSAREMEVLKLIAGGYRSREIAKTLSLSPKTIEKHRSNLMRKLKLRSAAAVAAFAIANGVVRP